MDKTAKKGNRGGAREGAGRKGLGNTKRVSICLTDELVPVFKQFLSTNAAFRPAFLPRQKAM